MSIISSQRCVAASASARATAARRIHHAITSQSRRLSLSATNHPTRITPPTHRSCRSNRLNSATINTPQSTSRNAINQQQNQRRYSSAASAAMRSTKDESSTNSLAWRAAALAAALAIAAAAQFIHLNTDNAMAHAHSSSDRHSRRNRDDDASIDRIVNTLCLFARQGELQKLRDYATQHNLVNDDDSDQDKNTQVQGSSSSINKSSKHPIASLPCGTLGSTPLHVAVANGQFQIADWLLQHGCDVNARDAYDAQPAMLWRIDSLNELYAARDKLFPDFTARAQFAGCTPLHYAVMRQDLEMVKLLLAQGADANAVNSAGHSPIAVPQSPSVPLRYKQFVEQVAQLASVASQEREREAAKIARAERVKFPLEQKLSELMVGQLMPIYSVSSAMRRRINGWYDSNKPLVFMFLGSSGVGKTMLAKSLAEVENVGNEKGFIRLDMSEYQSKHEMSRLIGSPPGYIGHEQGGQLTTALSACPSAVVLLDEIEKCHPDLLTLMLQVFDEGRLTDGQGKTIHCPNAVFIMTSNLVQEEIREAQESGEYMLRPADVKRAQLKQQLQHQEQALLTQSRDSKSGSDSQQIVAKLPITTETIVPVPTASDCVITPTDEAQLVDADTLAIVAESTDRFLRSTVHPILKRHFRRDEFIGRINDFICFHPFSRDDLRHTVQTELKRWQKKALERHSMELHFTDRVIESLLSAYDEKYGYRSIIYAVEKRIVNVLAVAHERDLIQQNDVVTLDIEAGPAAGSGPGRSGSQGKIVIQNIQKGAAACAAQPQANSSAGPSSGASGPKKFFGLF